MSQRADRHTGERRVKRRKQKQRRGRKCTAFLAESLHPLKTKLPHKTRNLFLDLPKPLFCLAASWQESLAKLWFCFITFLINMYSGEGARVWYWESHATCPHQPPSTWQKDLQMRPRKRSSQRFGRDLTGTDVGISHRWGRTRFPPLLQHPFFVLGIPHQRACWTRWGHMGVNVTRSQRERVMLQQEMLATLWPVWIH